LSNKDEAELAGFTSIEDSNVEGLPLGAARIFFDRICFCKDLMRAYRAAINSFWPSEDQCLGACT
jgi:hypothetical protein